MPGFRIRLLCVLCVIMLVFLTSMTTMLIGLRHRHDGGKAAHSHASSHVHTHGESGRHRHVHSHDGKAHSHSHVPGEAHSHSHVPEEAHSSSISSGGESHIHVSLFGWELTLPDLLEFSKPVEHLLMSQGLEGKGASQGEFVILDEVLGLSAFLNGIVACFAFVPALSRYTPPRTCAAMADFLDTWDGIVRASPPVPPPQK